MKDDDPGMDTRAQRQRSVGENVGLGLSELIDNVAEGGGGPDVPKLATGIVGFDALGFGGVPQARATLIRGTAGSGKTVFAIQFLAAAVRAGRGAVHVTFEESPDDVRRNMASFGWDLQQWEQEGKLVILDASPTGDAERVIGQYNLDALVDRVVTSARRINADRVAFDSLSGLIEYSLGDTPDLRFELFSLMRKIRENGLTLLMTVERPQDYMDGVAGTSLTHIDEFLADSVVVLRNVLSDERRRRTMEIVKYRGSRHHEGEVPFTIDHARGIVAMPLSTLRLTQESGNARVSSGSATLDQMCGGGFYRDGVILVSGPTGTGKTLLTTLFTGCAGRGDSDGRALFLAYEESREQLHRNALGVGIDLEKCEKAGRLRLHCQYPETQSLQAHLLEITRLVNEYKPTRLVIDSLTALERVAAGNFREFLIGLSSLVKRERVATMVTTTDRSLLGSKQVTEQHISTMTDSIILLRYVEVGGSILRGLMVLKMRGSPHEKGIRQFEIGPDGINIRSGFKGLSGILIGDVRESEGDSRELNA